MRLEQLRSFALSLPQTSFVPQWGGLVFKVVEKAFLVVTLDGQIATGCVFKCTGEEFDELTEMDGIEQAPYFAKRMWVKVSDLSVLSSDELIARIRHSYDLVVSKLPKKVQATLQ